MTRDTDGSPKGRDAQRLDGVAATAGAGTVSREHTPIIPQQADRESSEMREALRRARATAMRFTVDARIPECGKFGEIAQDLDAIVNSLDAILAHHAQQARLEEQKSAGHRIRKLEAALRVSRGWVNKCSEDAQARRDLRTIDEALGIDAIHKGEAE